MQDDRQFETRNTIYIDSDLKKEIWRMAQEKKWSFSYMSYVLLQQAVKEKNRKKKPKLTHEKDIQ